MEPTLFEPADVAGMPLAARMRPRTLDEVVGQAHLVGPGSPLRALLQGGGRPVSVILWGPPGTGKTTLAQLISSETGRRYVELSAVTSGVKEVRDVIDTAKDQLGMMGRQTVLFVDEVHRFSKSQQDSLLPAVENGWVTLVAATTENPSFSVISPLLSRSLLLTLSSLSEDDVRAVLHRAISDERGLAGRCVVAAEAIDFIVSLAGGDARRALTILEAVAVGADVSVADVEAAVQRAAIRYDRSGDQHYDVVSAFIKSVRGSDVDASLHYLARMLEAGEDPRFIARRLLILASEDIGLADSSALTVTQAAASAVAMLGMPEARITLAHATIHCALAPKSNSVIVAIDAAAADVRAGLIGDIPPHLRDAHYRGAAALGHGQGYAYPHDVEGGVAVQQYAPDPVVDRIYYRPGTRGAEARWTEVVERLREVLRPRD